MPVHHNPVVTGFNPDPSIVRVGKSYYLVTSTFEYFPGLPVYHSTDIVNWTLIGHALTRPSQLNLRTGEPGSGIWAPTIRHHDGRFYITSALWTAYSPQQNVRVWPRGFYVSTTDPWDSNSWTDPLYFDQPGFDQDLFWDDDDRVYLSTCYRAIDHDPSSSLKGFAVHVSEIDLETGDSLCPPRLVRKSPSGVAEGSHIIKKGHFYYLFVAEGGTESGHSEWVFRSRDGPYGPWEAGPNNPLIGATTQDDAQNTGHADLVEDDAGNWWAVCLAVRPYRQKSNFADDEFVPSPFGRESFLMTVDWKDDWPTFNKGQKMQLTLEKEQAARASTLDWRDDFEGGGDLALGWYQKNTPLKREYSLDEHPGHLRLHGGPYELNSLESPTIFLRKQTQRRGIWETRLDFDPSEQTYEAGTVLYWNCYTFASIGARKGTSETERELRFMRPGASSGSFDCTIHRVSNAGPIRLAISCTETEYRLGYASAPRDEYEWFKPIPMEVMTADPPRGMAFTGMMFGLYAFGDLQKCLSPADFAFASWTTTKQSENK